MHDIYWRFLFFVVYLVFFFIRSGKKTKEDPENLEKYLEKLNSAVKREGKLYTLRIALSFLLLFCILIYAGYPSWLSLLALPIPAWLRLTCLGLAVITLPLLNWAHLALGRHYSPDLVIIEEHVLITEGPYKFIRHPMYTFLLIFMLSISIFTANAIIFVPHLLSGILLLLRLDNEEEMLIQEFGDEYRRYMLKTGRLWPKSRFICKQRP
ncbi:MAG: isoprenylcysteine carboxylmethyltransferase family protein [Clostridiales bacterium]|nr:isoprenylcysteine carboxylmethyltransferase family protein [Clostridiales bacterium]